MGAVEPEERKKDVGTRAYILVTQGTVLVALGTVRLSGRGIGPVQEQPPFSIPESSPHFVSLTSE